MKRYLLLLSLTFWISSASAQRRVADSIRALLTAHMHDTSRVILLWNLSRAYYSFKPDSAILFGEEALLLAQKINYIEGEAKSLPRIANACLQIGNYSLALEYYLRWLKLEEKRDDPARMASVLHDIGIVYVYQEEYSNVLSYYYRADSIMKTIPPRNVTTDLELRYAITNDIGDLYYRINKLDSAFIYFQESLAIATQQKNSNYIGTSSLGLGEVSLRKKDFNQARIQFTTALNYLAEANNEDLLCETYLGLANLYDSLGRKDSVKLYARQMMQMARKDGFLNWQLKASTFLNSYYKEMKNVDSAYLYLELSQQLHDSVNSNEKIRQLQVISSNEQIRQTDMAEQKRKAKVERLEELQLLGIGIFIPLLFLLILLISRRKIHVAVLRLLGVISLLILFEYLTLLLHPYVAEITHHTPIYELLIFVCIAAVLIRFHHRIETWFVDKLIHSKKRFADGHIPIKRIKIKMRKPPGNSHPG